MLSALFQNKSTFLLKISSSRIHKSILQEPNDLAENKQDYFQHVELSEWISAPGGL